MVDDLTQKTRARTSSLIMRHGMVAWIVFPSLTLVRLLINSRKAIDVKSVVSNWYVHYCRVSVLCGPVLSVCCVFFYRIVLGIVRATTDRVSNNFSCSTIYPQRYEVKAC